MQNRKCKVKIKTKASLETGLLFGWGLDNRMEKAKKADFVRHTGVNAATQGCAVAVEGEWPHRGEKKVQSKDKNGKT